MTRRHPHRGLSRHVERQARRQRQATRERDRWLAQTVHLGTLGLAIVLPIVAGAYLGLWLDRQTTGYSGSWTVTLIVLGVVVGAVNAWLLVRE